MSSTDGGEKNAPAERKIASNGKYPAKDQRLDAVFAHLSDLRARRPTAVIETGRNEKTKKTIHRILTSARTVFTRNGHAGLSLRKVSDDAGLAVGNLTYHFPTKDTLLRAMLHEALADYVDTHIAEFERNRHSPLETLLNIIEFYIRNGRTSHQFFYQVWGFAGSSPEAKDMVRKLYQPIGRFAYYLVRAANPDLTDTQIRQVTLQIFSLEEGYKLFLGLGPEDAVALNTAEEDVRALAKHIILAGSVPGEREAKKP